MGQKPSGKPFWSNTKRNEATGCIEWVGKMYPLGYGRALVVDGEPREDRAHRRAWIMANGPIPGGLSVLHRCDNRACVNPQHLFLGTQHDNVRDMHEKGRAAKVRGEEHFRGAFLNEDVHRIREAYLFGAKQVDLAAVYGVCQTTISRVKRREVWAHVS